MREAACEKADRKARAGRAVPSRGSGTAAPRGQRASVARIGVARIGPDRLRPWRLPPGRTRMPRRVEDLRAGWPLRGWRRQRADLPMRRIARAVAAASFQHARFVRVYAPPGGGARPASAALTI